MLLTEFDPTKSAVINPDIVHHLIPDFPEAVVSIFSHQLFDTILNFLGGKVIAETHDVDGVWPVYDVTYKGKRFAFYKARFLYAGDNLDHSNWDPRSLSGNARLEDKEKIALLAFELACRIS